MKDIINQLFRDESLIQNLETLTSKNGALLNELLEPLRPVDPINESSARIDLRNKLSCFINIFSTIIGVQAAHVGIDRIFDLFQSEILNQHLLFTLCDYTVNSIIESILLSRKVL
jgi:hypothetical protein